MLTKKELERKMSSMFLGDYWNGTSAYGAFLNAIEAEFTAGEVSEKIMRWAHEIDARLCDVAQC